MVMNKNAALLMGLFSMVFAFPSLAEWQSLKPMPAPTSEMSAVSIDGKIYVSGGFGGLRTLQAYAIATDRWETLAPLPESRHHLMTVAHEGKLYVFGGGDDKWQPVNSAWAYDPDTNRWRPLTAMPESRFAGGAVALGDFIFVVGGTGPTGKTLRYDPKQDRWKVLKSTNQRREHIAAVVTEGKILVIGGRFRGVGELNSTEIYDPVKDEWHEGPSLNAARGGHAAVVHHGSVMVFGGEIIMQPDKKTLGDSERLDRLSGSWHESWRLPLPLHGLSAVSNDRALYILGGSQRAGAIVNHGRVFRYSERAANGS